MTINVVVADDQALVRAGFRFIIDSADDMKVVGEAEDGEQAVELTIALHPDVVLMDIRMPNADGLRAARRILQADQTWDVHILMLTTFDLDEYVFEALRAGAAGFLLKDALPDELLSAIRVVANGEALLAPRAARTLIRQFLRQSPTHVAIPAQLDSLTERERQVFRLIADGCANSEIAQQLFLSTATVKTHVSRLLMKLGARDRVQLVVIAYETGFVDPASQ